MGRPWEEIEQHYADIDCNWCQSMSRLARCLAHFPGLQGVTSMDDLIVSQASNIFDNPRLRIGPAEAHFHGPIIARISYQSGPQGSVCKDWHVDVDWHQLNDRVERILVKRLRWYKKT